MISHGQWPDLNIGSLVSLGIWLSNVKTRKSCLAWISFVLNQEDIQLLSISEKKSTYTHIYIVYTYVYICIDSIFYLIWIYVFWILYLCLSFISYMHHKGTSVDMTTQGRFCRKWQNTANYELQTPQTILCFAKQVKKGFGYENIFHWGGKQTQKKNLKDEEKMANRSVLSQ